jgi:hypothetical protein
MSSDADRRSCRVVLRATRGELAALATLAADLNLPVSQLLREAVNDLALELTDDREPLIFDRRRSARPGSPGRRVYDFTQRRKR